MSVGEDEIVLEMDSGDGYTMMCVHLTSLSCALKNDQNGTFYCTYFSRVKNLCVHVI